jgi:hypothetical protein
MFSQRVVIVAVVAVVSLPAHSGVHQAPTGAAETAVGPMSYASEGAASCTHPLFANPRYAAGDGPSSAAIGDLDGVNGPDLAVANPSSDAVSVLLNQGDGTFAAPEAYAAGYHPSSVAIGDLDGVNGPDLAVAYQGPITGTEGYVSVLLNQGDGTFAAAVAYVTGYGPESVAIGDLDGANGPDLAVAYWDDDQLGGGVSVLLNQGDGTFSAAVANWSVGMWPYSVAVGDLDGVNGPDLAVAHRGLEDFASGDVSVLLNQGDGTFAGPEAYDAGYHPSSVAIGDLDGVNGPDLAVAYRDHWQNPGGGRVSVLLNQGDGTFGGGGAYAAANEPFSVAVEDLDGVNGPDLAVANVASDDVSVLLNQGDGTFAVPVAYAAGNEPEAVAIGDLDGVNGADLTVANWWSDDVLVLLNQGDGTFAPAVAYAAGNGPEAVAIGDLDGVNGPDLAVANVASSDNVSVLLNQGDGTFAPAVAYTAGWYPLSVAVGDLDGVNGPDLAVANRHSDDVSVLLNQGEGTFGAAVAYAAGNEPEAVAIGDLDGGNGPDLAVAGSGVLVLLNQGDGTFAPAVAYDAGRVLSVAVGDLDGVNGPDLAMAYEGHFPDWDGGVSVLLNQGDGTFAAAIAYRPGEHLTSVAIGDLDGVNGSDLAVANASSDAVSVLLNQGDGTFAAAVAYAAGNGPVSVAIGDLDGANGPDLAVANRYSDDVAVLLNLCASEPCPWDLNGNGFVWIFDLLLLLFSWGPCDGDCPADFDGDGFVGILDFLDQIWHFGPCPD